MNSCASAHWRGTSGCLANPTPHTGYEPNFYTYMNEEHTPINLPDSHRNFPRRDDATTITSTEDPGASSSSKQVAASRVPTMVGSVGSSLWKQWRDHESVDSRNGIQETGAKVNISTNSLNGKLILASQDREWLSKTCMKLEQKLMRGIGKREILTSIFKRSIRSLNLNDFSYIQQVDGQIRLRDQGDKVSLYGELELRSRLFQEDYARDCQEIEEFEKNFLRRNRSSKTCKK